MVSKYTVYRKNILKLIYQNENISRKNLHDLLNLRFATITHITRDLIKEGIIEESGKRKRKSKGRPHELLKIIPNSKYFIGCELTPEKIISVILNFKGEFIGQKTVNLDETDKKEEILIKIVNLLKNLIEESKIEKNKICGIGFVDPGIVDMQKGVSVFSSILPGWENVHIRDYLKQKLSINTLIIGSSQSKVLSEKFLGKGRKSKNIIFIEYGKGIACGIINDNKIIHGQGGVAGEFGHVKIPYKDEICNCGKRGCLESIISVPAILKKIKDVKGTELKMNEIIERYEKGDSEIKKFMDDVFNILVFSVSNLINILNPEIVIFDKNFLVFEKEFKNIFEKIKENMVYEYPVSFEISDFGEEIGAIGGACLVISNFLGLDI
ncbi:MAG TPA: ROK family protein [bacterium]|nr:ROK family protein [bacterium]HOM25967.1 ROK family protein [bacterium]